MKKVFLIIIISILFVLNSSCTKKGFSEYNENEFYKVQGIIISDKATDYPFDSAFMKKIKYEYFINDTLILKGSENFSFKDMVKGMPIEVLVHKKNEKISFYWRNGISKNITEYQLQYVKKEMEKILYEGT